LTKAEHELRNWIMSRTEKAQYFVTLTFSHDVSKQRAEQSAKHFQKRVSVAVAGNRGRNGKYQHGMVFFIERQPQSRNWHLHIMIDEIPKKYKATIKTELNEICARTWNSMNGTGKTHIVGGNGEWFKAITDRAKLTGYVTKTYKWQSSDCLVVI